MWKMMRTSESRSRTNRRAVSERSAGSKTLLTEALFTKQLSLERKRTERSGRRFVLMLLDSSKLVRGEGRNRSLDLIISALAESVRETDIQGWYAESVIGVIFTEIGPADGGDVSKALLGKVSSALCRTLPIDEINEISLSFHIYPEEWDGESPAGPKGSRLYPDLTRKSEGRRVSEVLKRTIDVLGSLFLLAISSPLLLLIAAAVKLTSEGPVLYRQTRLGQCGKRFTFYKFRSMYARSEHTIHEQYVSNYIAGKLTVDGHKDGKPIFKMTKDPRVTAVGRFLRRTSLDEFPQFFNVLRGDMSLVGPRPPLPYEFGRYGVWHKRRLLAVKPGITGVWQVEGRSKVPFDEMVRLDLEYARSWSVWMDIKILLKTPLAMVSSDGAH